MSTLIHTPDSAKQKSQVFEVVCKGEDCVDDAIQPGTIIYTGQFAPMHLDFPGQPDWWTINEVDAVGMVTEFEVEQGEIKEAS